MAGTRRCDGYFGEVEATSPYDLRIGPMRTTRMACPPPKMELEDRYLAALDQAAQFGFLNGRLALTHGKPEGVGTLLLEPTAKSLATPGEQPAPDRTPTRTVSLSPIPADERTGSRSSATHPDPRARAR